jgi:hypothetical protein
MCARKVLSISAPPNEEHLYSNTNAIYMHNATLHAYDTFCPSPFYTIYALFFSTASSCLTSSPFWMNHARSMNLSTSSIKLL